MFTCVTTTKIFCTDTCPAHPPNAENRIMMATVRDCVAIGCRPCKRCKPMHDKTNPDWLDGFLNLVEAKASKYDDVTEKELSQLGLTKQFLGRWFTNQFGFTCEAYCRMRRIASQLGAHYFRTGTVDGSVGRKKLFQKLFESKKVTVDEKQTPLLVNRIVTPLGPMVVFVDDQSVILLEFADRRMLESQIVRVAKRFQTGFRIGVNRVLVQLNRELGEYFLGKRATFSVPTNREGTPFQSRMWEQLVQIRCGEKKSYEQIATELGNSKAVRAVGRANGDNRLTILVPCHRLVGSDGSLTGYGGGLDRKQWLLDHEAQLVSRMKRTKSTATKSPTSPIG